MYRSLIFLLLVLVVQRSVAQDQLSQQRVERLYERGTELVSHANYGAARQVFTEFLASATPTDARRSEAEYYVAFSALNLGHRDGEKLIDQFIDRNPSSPKASTAYYDLANFFYTEGNYTKSLQYFRKVDFPALTTAQQSEGHFKWGYSFFNQKKLDEALEQFNFVKRESNAFSPAANYYAGFIEYTKGKYEDALIDLKKAEASPSYSKIVPYLVASVYYKQKRYDTLIEYAATLKGRTDLNNASDLSMLVAEAYYFKGDFKQASDAYQKYFDNNAQAEGGLLFRAGYANYVSGNTDRGIEYLDKAAAGKDTVSYYASYYLGILYLKQGNKLQALNAFDYARKNPKDNDLSAESAFQFGKVSYDAGKSEQAIAAYEQFLKMYPGNVHQVEVKELLAQAYVNGNNFTKAIEYIESLPSRNQYINQAYQKAAYLKGSDLFNKEQYEEARIFFDKSLEYPIDANYTILASYWNGETNSLLRDYEAAAKHYLTIVAQQPPADAATLQQTRYGLGYAYYNLKQYDRALFNFREFTNKSSKNTPNFADGLIRLADCYYVSKQYSDALATYNRAKTAGSADNDYVLLQAGTIAGIQKQYAEARTAFNDLIKNYPRSTYRDDAMFQRAQFEIEQGNHQAAVDGLSQLIRESANSGYLPAAYMRRAASYFNLKQYDRTVADYQTLIRQYPQTKYAQEALLPLQEAMNNTGQSSDFNEYLQVVKNANPENRGIESLEFETAKNLVYDQQYSKAVNALNAYIQSYPQSANAQEARFLMAESYYRMKQFDNAIPVYTDLARDPMFDKGSRVAARLGEIYFKQGQYQAAIGGYHRLERVAINKKEQFNAWSGLMESFYLLGQYDSADVYARTILERGNVNAGAQNKASLYLGKSAMARGDYESAKDEFLNTLNSAQDEFGAEAKYLLGQIFFLQKDYKHCYETLVSLNNDFATYDEWVGKSFLLLADNYEAQGDIFQTRATLQSLVDRFPLPHVKEAAQKKLLKLDQAQQLEKQKAAEADTTDQ